MSDVERQEEAFIIDSSNYSGWRGLLRQLGWARKKGKIETRVFFFSAVIENPQNTPESSPP